MRVDANVSVRRVGDDRARHAVRDQEPQLAAVARPGDRVRGRAPDRRCSRPASGSCRRPATGTRTTAARTRCASKEEADDYRYFPEPDLVPLEPDDEWIDADRAPRCPLLPAERRAAPGRRPPASRPTTGRSRSPSSAASTSWRSRRHRGRRRPGAGCSSTSSTTSPSTGAGARRPGALAALVAPGGRRRADRHAGQDGAGRDGRRRATRPRGDRRRRTGFEAMDTGALEARRRRGHRRQPRRVGSSFRDGDDKARGKLTGFFVGQVMKATKGKADGKVVTARLRELAG